MIASGYLMGMWIAGREAERKGLNTEILSDFFLYVIIGAIMGARIYYVAFGDRAGFLKNPLSVFAIWQGGLAIHGGILGGLIIAVLFTKRHQIPFWQFADAMTPSLILGQAIGRIGCFLNGDAHGYPTDKPWGLIYSPDSPAGQMFPAQPLHPTQLYEMFFDLIIFGILWIMRKKIKGNGQLFLLYIVLYSSIRIFVEHFRADRLTFMGNISSAQSIGILGVILGISLMLILRQNRKTSCQP